MKASSPNIMPLMRNFRPLVRFMRKRVMCPAAARMKRMRKTALMGTSGMTEGVSPSACVEGAYGGSCSDCGCDGDTCQHLSNRLTPYTYRRATAIRRHNAPLVAVLKTRATRREENRVGDSRSKHNELRDSDKLISASINHAGEEQRKQETPKTLGKVRR